VTKQTEIDSRKLPTSVAWILFGGVTMVMAAFYLTSYHDKDIVDATWLVISNAVSLFCAVLLFLAFREAIALATDGEDIQDRRLGAAAGGFGYCWAGGYDAIETVYEINDDGRRLEYALEHRRLAQIPTQKTLTVDSLCFIFVFFAWEMVLFTARKKGGTLAGLGLIAAHCMGFSTLYAFGNMQQCEPFRNNPGMAMIVVILAFTAVVLICSICNLVRRRMIHYLGCHDSHAHNWAHQCEHTEREALAFAVSFCLAQVFKYISIGDLAPLHDVPKSRLGEDALKEFLFVAGLSICVISAGVIEHGIAEHHGHEELEAHKHGHEMTRLQLMAHMVKDTLAFTCGWSLLTLIKVGFWSATDDKGLLGEGDVMTSHLVVVFISSAITFTIFFMIDGAADRIHGRFSRGLRSLGKAFMLLLGLAWEGAFWEGAHSMSVGMGFEQRQPRMLVVIVLSLIFCGIVMPAWIIYIVPHTVEIEEDGELHAKDYDDHESPVASKPHTSVAEAARKYNEEAARALEGTHDTNGNGTHGVNTSLTDASINALYDVTPAPAPAKIGSIESL